MKKIRNYCLVFDTIFSTSVKGVFKSKYILISIGKQKKLLNCLKSFDEFNKGVMFK